MARQEMLFALISSDWRTNPRNWKGRVLLILYRIAHACVDAPVWLKPLCFLYIAVYKLLTEMVIGTEIHWRATIGRGARLYHAYGLVVNSGTVIGDNVVLRHGVTIGEKDISGKLCAPIIGNNVDIGAGAILLGKIIVGEGAVIGAGAVVVDDVAAATTVVGNPARTIEKRRL